MHQGQWFSCSGSDQCWSPSAGWKGCSLKHMTRLTLLFYLEMIFECFNDVSVFIFKAAPSCTIIKCVFTLSQSPVWCWLNKSHNAVCHAGGFNARTNVIKNYVKSTDMFRCHQRRVASVLCCLSESEFHTHTFTLTDFTSYIEMHLVNFEVFEI